MKKSGLVLLFSCFLASAACATTGAVSGGDHEAMIAQAEEAYKSVDKAGGAWRDTAEMITSAKKEAEAGNTTKAYELAKKAYDEAKMASQQIQAAQSAAPWLF